MTNHETRQLVRKGITMKVDYQSEDLATLGQWIFHSAGELDRALNPTDKAPAPNPETVQRALEMIRDIGIALILKEPPEDFDDADLDEEKLIAMMDHLNERFLGEAGDGPHPRRKKRD